MRALRFRRSRLLLAVALPVAIAACAPAPLYRTGPSVVVAAPQQVLAAPRDFKSAEIVSGGRVVSVRNLANQTEIEILGYPLDSSQRPRIDQPPYGRFIAIVPGFVEPMNYPEGSLVTLRGTVIGSRQGEVGSAGYSFPLVRSTALHRWTPEEMREGHPNIRIGVGVGGWIR